MTTRNDDPKQTRAMAEGERPLVRHAERFRLAGAGQTIEGAGTILRVGSKEGNSLRLQN